MSYTKICEIADDEALREDIRESTESVKILAAIEAIKAVKNED